MLQVTNSAELHTQCKIHGTSITLSGKCQSSSIRGDVAGVFRATSPTRGTSTQRAKTGGVALAVEAGLGGECEEPERKRVSE